MLLELRDTLKEIYMKYDTWLDAIGKFVLAFLSFQIVNMQLGQMQMLNNLLLVMVLSLACSFLPLNTVILVMAGIALVHSYAIGIPALAVAAGVLMMVLLLYFGVAPEQALAFLLTPVALEFQSMLAIPLIFGLLCGPKAGVGILFGNISFFTLEEIGSYALTNQADQSGLSEGELLLKGIQDLLKGILGNSEMILSAIVMIAVLFIVYAVRRLAIKYAWQMAIGIGTVIYLILEIFGKMTFQVGFSYLPLLFGTVVSVLLAVVLQGLCFQLDYRRVESLQFEDDDYYYYVKAVPKRKRERTVEEWKR